LIEEPAAEDANEEAVTEEAVVEEPAAEESCTGPQIICVPDPNVPEVIVTLEVDDPDGALEAAIEDAANSDTPLDEFQVTIDTNPDYEVIEEGNIVTIYNPASGTYIIGIVTECQLGVYISVDPLITVTADGETVYQETVHEWQSYLNITVPDGVNVQVTIDTPWDDPITIGVTGICQSCYEVPPCDECEGERVVVIPEEERGEWIPNGSHTEDGIVYLDFKRVVSKDALTDEPCEWEYKSVPQEPPSNPTAKVTPEPAPALCEERDVRIVIRTDPETHNQTLMRIWVNDATGETTRTLDLFEKFPEMRGQILNHDIYNLNGCWVYFVFLPQGEDLAQIWRVSSMGTTLEQLANEESGPFNHVATAFDGTTAYTNDGVVELADANAQNAETTQVFADQLEFAGNNDLFARNGDSLMSFETEMVFDITRGGFALMPDGEGFYFMDGPFAVPFYFAEGLNPDERVLAKELALSPYPDDQRKLLGLFGQVWLRSPEVMNQITDGMSAINDLYGLAWWETPSYSQPDWWVAEDLRVVYNSSAITLASQVATVNNNGGEDASEPPLLCGGYDGTSIDDCLGSSDDGLKESYWNQYGTGGDYTGSADQNYYLVLQFSGRVD